LPECKILSKLAAEAKLVLAEATAVTYVTATKMNVLGIIILNERTVKNSLLDYL
jgi:hypothetical protein